MNWFFFALGSAVLSAVAAVLQKRALQKIDALRFSFLVSLVVLIFSLGVSAPFLVTVPSPSSMVLLIVKSLLGGLAFLLVMISLERNQISTALPLLGLTPALTAVLAMIVLGDALRLTEWIGIALMMIGVFLVESGGGKPGVLNRRYLPIMGALILFAVSSIADKVLLSSIRLQPAVVMVYQHVIYCALFAALLLARRVNWKTTFQVGRTELWLIACVAVVTVGYRWAQLEATRSGSVALVLAVKRTSILMASFFGGRLFADDRLKQKLIGAALIAGAGCVILNYLS